MSDWCSVLLYLCAPTAALLACLWRYGWIVTPDGQAYMMAARGAVVPSPFRWRVLPRLIGRWPTVWRFASWTSLLLSAVLVGLYAEQHGLPAWAATALWVTLPWFRGLTRMPLLTDQIGMAAALGCAVTGQWWAVVPLALLAGSASERAPVFAAVFAWSPLPLVGLIVPAIAALTTKRGDLPWTDGHNDFWRIRDMHNQAQPHVYLLPFGATLLSVLGVTWQWSLALGLGIAQWMVATDRARLLQWGAPVLVVVTLQVVPTSWLPLLVLYQVVAPWCDWSHPWK